VFNYPILLGSTRCTNLKYGIIYLRKRCHKINPLFSNPIGSKPLNFSVQLVFHLCFVSQELFLNLIFTPNEVNFGIFGAITYKGDRKLPPLVAMFFKSTTCNPICLLTIDLNSFFAYFASTHTEHWRIYQHLQQILIAYV